jgi:predicted small lipoprotein YifL
MKRAIAIVMLLTLAACGADGEPKPPQVHQRQQPSATEPGVSVSGSAEFGVVKNF